MDRDAIAMTATEMPIDDNVDHEEKDNRSQNHKERYRSLEQVPQPTNQAKLESAVVDQAATCQKTISCEAGIYL